ncbi:hypothetical protein OB08_13775 [Microbacterium sp. HJ5]
MTGRLLAAHWPALVAWYLAGTLGRYLGIELAGFVGGYSALGGMLLLPLPILAKLISVVAMFLVLRDGMVRLGAIAPPPADRDERLRSFRDALLSSVLPFIAVYALLGFLVEDVAAYLDAALAVQSGREFAGLAESVETGVTVAVDTSGAVTELAWEPWTIAVIVLAFAGRWAWKRWQMRLPRWTALVATYLEALWIFLAAYFIGEALDQVTGWIESRQAMAWLADARAWIGGWFAPLGWAWDAVGWVLGEVGALILVPLAWLTIAGVIYGQAVSPEGVQWRGRLVEEARARYGSVPQRVRRRLGDIGSGVGSRFRPVWRAIVLMWRSGPILIGGYVLLYAIVMFAEQWLRIGLIRLVGPHDFWTFWLVAGTPLLLLVPLVIEPVRTAVIASAYDATIGALIGAPAAPSGRDDESDEPGQLVADLDVDAEGPLRVVGEQEWQREGERPGRL